MKKMFNFLKKFILLSTLISTHLLYADGVLTSIGINNAPSVSEADAGSKKMTFMVTLSESPLLFTTVNYTTVNGSATAGSDYVAQSGSLTFLAWDTSKTIEVDILDDTIYEGDENFYVQISTTASGYEVSGSGQGYGTITDNELPPLEIRSSNVSITEGDIGTNPINFRIYLNQPAPTGGVTVNYNTADYTALANDDYTSTAGSVTIPAGQTEVYVPVPIVGDLTPEVQEKFYFKLTNTNVGTLKTTKVSGYIKDNDAINVRISSTNIQEGNLGDTHQMVFKIFLAKAYPLTTPLTINYQTQDGSTPSATANVDYTSKSGSVTFNQGDIEKLVYVDIVGDNDIEPNEYLKLAISGSDYITKFDSQSLILNDDGNYPKISFSQNEFSITEGDSGQKNLNFTFTLSKPALAGATFHYETWDNSAKIGDNDYVYTHGDQTVLEGAKSVTISVPINGDTKIEADEYFYFGISNLTNLNLNSVDQVQGKIINDDGAYPTLTFNSNAYAIPEGNSGQTDINFTLTLDAPALSGSSFDYYTQNGTAQVGDNDYVAIPTTTHVIPVGATQITLPVKINGDTNIESDESFSLMISNEVNLTLANSNSASGTILNDDGSLPEFSIQAPTNSIFEGNSSQTKIDCLIKLTPPATHDGVTINYQTLNGSAMHEDSDYDTINPTSVVFNTNESEKTISVYVNGDVKIEGDETFNVQILNPIGATITKGQNTVTLEIKNDDEHSDDPLVCDSTMYLSSSINRSDPNAKGKMWLHTIDTTKNPFNFLVMNEDGSDKLYNALAYSDTDNYIYGLYKKELIKLTKTGKVISLGNVDELPSILTTKQLFAGAIYGEYYYISGPGEDYNKIFKIKLSDKSVSEITLNTAVSLLDFSFTPDGHYLHGIVDGGKLVKIDVDVNSSTLGDVTFIGLAHTGYQFDSTFSDKNGRFFANDSGGHGFFEFNLDTGDKLFLSASGNATFNDGANCLKAELIFTDYGDAPSTYGTARHTIANGMFLGNEVDHDIQSYSDSTATGDDTHGIDDEDGVTLLDGTDLNGSYFLPDANQELKIKFSKEGYLNAWIDYDANGVFDASDKIVNAQLFTAGEHTISFNVPASVIVNQTTYLRFRFSSTANLDAIGNASDGEVEDYAVKFGSAFQPLRGMFNIERTNSGTYPIHSEARDAWYTQIVGRDFDYSVVFYNEEMSEEKEVDNVTVKVELVNTETNTTLYTQYAHIKNSPVKSRIDNTLPTDLMNLPASKDVHFRISYGVDDSGAIIQADCSGDPRICFENFTKTRTNNALDNFAIRPERFYMVLSDGAKIRKINQDNDPTTPLRLASGYEYNLSVTATQYKANHSIVPSPDYNQSLNGILLFQSSNSCANRDNATTPETFKEGKNITPIFKHNNVGLYLLHLEDSNWTAIDSQKIVPDCEVTKSTTSINGNILSGCNIVSKSDMNISFYPYQFAIDFTMNNLPNSGHDNFIYMSDINESYNNVAIQFQGDITAQAQNGSTCSNFTTGCVAEKVELKLDATVLSEDGINQPLQTSRNISDNSREDINFTRMVRFNNEPFSSANYTKTLDDIKKTITIDANKFKDENNGSTSVDLRYNINKHHSRTVNPIQVKFHGFDVNSTDAHSQANDKINTISTLHIPKGRQDLSNNVRHFYFTQVAPDNLYYPKINFHVNPVIRTPLNIEIFCDKNTSYCMETNVTTNSNPNASPRRQNGWYLSIKHNPQLDGNVTLLRPLPNIVTLSPIAPIVFNHGRNGIVITRFNNCVKPQTESNITIVPTPALQYDPNPSHNGLPMYQVSCEQPEHEWTGIGETGHIIQSEPHENQADKINW